VPRTQSLADSADSLCHVCGEFYTSGHMPGCPNSGAGQPCTWFAAAEEVLRQASCSLSLGELVYEIRKRGLRFVHTHATPKDSLRKALALACRTPGSTVRRVGPGEFVYNAQLC